MTKPSPRFHGDDGSYRINSLRRQFEQWYVGAAFDYTANPLGSKDCDLQWRAWLAASDAAAPEGAQGAAADAWLVFDPTHARYLNFCRPTKKDAEAICHPGCEVHAVYTTPPQPQDAEDAGHYYLASFKRKWLGGALLWWGPNDAGYTPDLQQAGVYTELKPGYHDSEDTVPVPVWFVRGGRFRIRHELDPGDSENGAFWNAAKLRAAIDAARAAGGGGE